MITVCFLVAAATAATALLLTVALTIRRDLPHSAPVDGRHRPESAPGTAAQRRLGATMEVPAVIL